MLRSWSLTLSLQSMSKLPLHIQIAQAIIDDVQKGRLKPGDTLPGSRVLALDLAVNRKTVVLAYDELQSQGWITQQSRRGAFISLRLPIAGQLTESILTEVTDLERVYDLLSNNAKNAKWMNCRLVLICPSQDCHLTDTN